MLRLIAIAVGVSTTMATTALASDFINMTWGPVTVGQMVPIRFTVGDNSPVSLFFGNLSWNDPIATNIPAASAEYDWVVTVPDGFVPGDYGLGIVQSGSSNFSPLFTISAAGPGSGSSNTTSATSGATEIAPPLTTTTSSAPYTPTANATLISAGTEPTVTVTYWDPHCGCRQTSVMPAPAAAATGGTLGTTYTWYDDHCGCTKTAIAPAATNPTSNYTAPVVTNAATNVPPPPPNTAAPAPTASTTPYSGDAARMVSSGLGIAVLIAAILA
ncbi:hypothetical protein PV08_04712 [Exophiala spinifera]|uniref:Uncharacterized protein n=1 Tax=Exophiala spinifera TaxID=91928 RepID=A0A0D2BEZ6_9EURO|nr:uncharacterized protein PV08_04712 [Exophiala spinifera]KIW17518.1 hypothetical protein PV08_04712 [Exophiala spinifera]